MPRKADTQTEEPASTLRRSSRTTAGTAGTPTSVKTRRGSLLTQENDEENTEAKPTPRTRRATSITKEEPQQKPEPAKTRSRRSSAANELPPAEEKRPTIRGRRASTTEDSAESLKDTSEETTTTTRKTIRSRRSSAQEDKVEEQPPVTKTPQRRNSVTENDESKTKVTRSRRLSVEKSEELIEEPPKRATRATRRSSVDKAEEEPEPKVAKPGTPKKPRRRLSVTETVVPLEPINEQETDSAKRPSTSPLADNGPLVKLTPVKKGEPKKTDLDLSIINETSFVEEVEPSPKKDQSPTSQSVNRASASPKELNIKLTPIKKKTPPKVSTELNAISEEPITKSGVTPVHNLSLKDEENRLGARRVSPRINKNALTPQKLHFSEDKEEQNLKSNSFEEDSVFVDTPSSLAEGPTPKTGTTISSGSDGSFSLHLSNSLMKTSSQDSQDDEAVLNTSNGSDKENIAVPQDKGKTKHMSEAKALAALTGSANIPPKSETYTVARVSNVFRPKNVECSFLEPMDVDKTVMESNAILNNSEVGEPANDNKKEKTECETNVPNATDEKETKEIEGDGSVLEVSFKSAEENVATSVKANVDDGSSKTIDNEDNTKFLSSVGEASASSSTEEKHEAASSQAIENSETEPKLKKQLEESTSETNSEVIPKIEVTMPKSEDSQTETSEFKSPVTVEASLLEDVAVRKTEDKPLKEDVERQISSSPKEKPLEITPEAEAKLLNDSVDETTMYTNKGDASQDFDFNIPSDEEHEDQQTDPKEKENSESKETEEKVDENSKETQNQDEKMDMSSDISVVILDEDTDKENTEEKANDNEKSEVAKISEEANLTKDVDKTTNEKTEESSNFNNKANENTVSSETDFAKCDQKTKDAPVSEVPDSSVAKENEELEKNDTEIKEIESAISEKQTSEIDQERKDNSKNPLPLSNEEMETSVISGNQTTKNNQEIKEATESTIKTDSSKNNEKSAENVICDTRSSGTDQESKDTSKYTNNESREISVISEDKTTKSDQEMKEVSSCTTQTDSSKNIEIEKSVQKVISKKDSSDNISSEIVELEKAEIEIKESFDSDEKTDGNNVVSEKTAIKNEEKVNDTFEKIIAKESVEVKNSTGTKPKESPTKSVLSAVISEQDLEKNSKGMEDASDGTILQVEVEKFVSKETEPKQITDINSENVLIVISEETKEIDQELKDSDEDEKKKPAVQVGENLHQAEPISAEQTQKNEDIDTNVHKDSVTDDKEMSPSESHDNEISETTNNAETAIVKPAEDLVAKEIETIVDNGEDTIEFDMDTSGPAVIEISVTAETRVVTEKVKDKTKKPVDVEDSKDNIDTIEIASEDEQIVECDSSEGSVQLVDEDDELQDNTLNKSRKTKKHYQTTLKKKNKSKDVPNEEAEDIESGDPELTVKKKRSKLTEEDEIESKKSNKTKKAKRKSNISKSTKVEEKDIDDTSVVESENLVEKSNNKDRKSSSRNTEELDADDTNVLSPSKSGETQKTTIESKLSKLDQYLDAKMQEIGEEEEESEDHNSFIDDMAAEGEEDTPSEDSNDIIDEGESINTTESEWSNEDYDDDDSFICDDEKMELLSGEEYDLDNAPEKTKKTRIINIDNNDEDVIKIEKKAKKKTAKKPKKSRIINVEDCEDEVITIDKKSTPPKRNKLSKIGLLTRSKDEEPSVVEIEYVDLEESATEKDEFSEEIQGDESVEPESTENESAEVESAEITGEQSIDLNESVDDESSQESLDKSGIEVTKTTEEKAQASIRRASINIQENIKVSDIQDPVLSKRINQLVDSFSKTIRKGDVSVNLSMEFDGSDGSASSEVVCLDDTNKSGAKRNKRNRSLKKKSDVETVRSPAKKPRLSVSLNNSDLSEIEGEPSTSGRMSVSADDVRLKKMRKKKMKKTQKKAKTDLLRGVQEKTIKRKSLSAEDLKAETFSLMSQLLNDVRNRPRRTVKPSSGTLDPNSSWIVDDIAEVKPSTSIITSKDIEQFKAKKIHMKDFKSQMLNDPSRVKRVDTKTLLKTKKWV